MRPSPQVPTQLGEAALQPSQEFVSHAEAPVQRSTQVKLPALPQTFCDVEQLPPVQTPFAHALQLNSDSDTEVFVDPPQYHSSM